MNAANRARAARALAGAAFVWLLLLYVEAGSISFSAFRVRDLMWLTALVALALLAGAFHLSGGTRSPRALAVAGVVVVLGGLPVGVYEHVVCEGDMLRTEWAPATSRCVILDGWTARLGGFSFVDGDIAWGSLWSPAPGWAHLLALAWAAGLVRVATRPPIASRA